MPFVDYLRPIIADADTGWVATYSYRILLLIHPQPWWPLCGYEISEIVC
jgi:hypothetical protein